MSGAGKAERWERVEGNAGDIQVGRSVGREMALAIRGHGYDQLQFAGVFAFEKVVEFLF